MLRRFLVLTCILFALCLLSITAIRTIERGQPANYNCISLAGNMWGQSEVSVQLNRHLNYYYAVQTSISPNGRYTLKVISTPAHQSSMVVLEDAQTNTITRLQQNKPLQYISYTLWSADSQYVAYTAYLYPNYTAGVYSIADAQNYPIKLPNAYRPLSFSDDNAYLVYQSNNSDLHFISLDTFQVYSVKSPATYWINYAWSPQGHRFAADTYQALLIVDVDHHTAHPITYSSELIGSPYLIEWSDHYLATQTYLGSDGSYHLYVFDDQYRVTGLTIPRTDDTIPYASRLMTWNHDQLLYFQPTIDSTPDAPRYALWSFDPATRQAVMIDSGIIHYSLNGSTIALQRADHTLEIRSGDVLKATLPLDESTTCDWLASTSPVLSCSSRESVTLLDPSGHAFWSSLPAHIHRTTYTIQGRFAAYILQQADDIWLELIDLQTGKSYVFPETLRDTLPTALLDVNSYAYFNLNVYPSPDGKIWLVKIYGNEASLYRFWPDQNRWETALARVQLADALWSPDSRRFAILQAASPHPNVMVGEADSAQIWNLGYFPAYENITWMQCGGLRARILGE